MIQVDPVFLVIPCYLGVPALQEHQLVQEVLQIRGYLGLHWFPVYQQNPVFPSDQRGQECPKNL